jgi:hypothetical protein
MHPHAELAQEGRSIFRRPFHGPALACVAGAVLWAVVNELLIQPREYSAFNLSLERLRDDPRIMVTLGTPVSGYGQVRPCSLRLAICHMPWACLSWRMTFASHAPGGCCQGRSTCG